MPEFAEVNKQVSWLRARCEGATVQTFGYSGGHFTALKDDPNKPQILNDFFTGASLQRVTQRGKHVVMHLSTGTLISHLMFAGRWSMEGDAFVSNYKHHKEVPTIQSINFWMKTTRGTVHFHEPEYKGKVHVFPGVTSGSVDELTALGPEIVVTDETDPDFVAPWTVETFRSGVARSKTAIKSFLLDQKKQAGIGNMYACESLYRAGIAPSRPSNSLSPSEASLLHQSVCDVINAAIQSDLDYATVLRVYRRDHDPEGRPVEMSEIGGRDTFWVPSVQT
jgi:formamidopyrimidine-DNA glycosylase